MTTPYPVVSFLFSNVKKKPVILNLLDLVACRRRELLVLLALVALEPTYSYGPTLSVIPLKWFMTIRMPRTREHRSRTEFSLALRTSTEGYNAIISIKPKVCFSINRIIHSTVRVS